MPAGRRETSAGTRKPILAGPAGRSVQVPSEQDKALVGRVRAGPDQAAAAAAAAAPSGHPVTGGREKRLEANELVPDYLIV